MKFGENGVNLGAEIPPKCRFNFVNFWFQISEFTRVSRCDVWTHRRRNLKIASASTGYIRDEDGLSAELFSFIV